MENINPQISVILPVYNAEKYLRRCIDSILAQTFTDFELLLIDDGSKDKSGEICDEYARKDNRVKVFHKENGGVSSARQFGVEKAIGKYSIHVDCDDLVSVQMLEEMYRTAEKDGYDIVITNYFHNDEYIVEEYPEETTQIIYDMLGGKIRGVMWNKLVNHSLYKRYEIYFPVGINFCEDVYVCTQLFLCTRKICHLNKAYYYYLDNSNSITRCLNKSILLQRVKFIEKITDLLLKKGLQCNCLFWHKIDIKWLMLDTSFFSFDEYRQYFNDIFSQYTFKEYPKYLKTIFILYVVNSRFFWNLFKKFRK